MVRRIAIVVAAAATFALPASAQAEVARPSCAVAEKAFIADEYPGEDKVSNLSCRQAAKGAILTATQSGHGESITISYLVIYVHGVLTPSVLRTGPILSTQSIGCQAGSDWVKVGDEMPGYTFKLVSCHGRVFTISTARKGSKTVSDTYRVLPSGKTQLVS